MSVAGTLIGAGNRVEDEETIMSKKNGGINDNNDASGEQSNIDGNSGISNLIDGEELPDPPTELASEQLEEAYKNAKTPTKRDSKVL